MEKRKLGHRITSYNVCYTKLLRNNATYYAFASDETNTTSDNAKSASETITEARYKAA